MTPERKASVDGWLPLTTKQKQVVLQLLDVMSHEYKTTSYLSQRRGRRFCFVYGCSGRGGHRRLMPKRWIFLSPEEIFRGSWHPFRQKGEVFYGVFMITAFSFAVLTVSAPQQRPEQTGEKHNPKQQQCASQQQSGSCSLKKPQHQSSRREKTEGGNGCGQQAKGQHVFFLASCQNCFISSQGKWDGSL